MQSYQTLAARPRQSLMLVAPAPGAAGEGIMAATKLRAIPWISGWTSANLWFVLACHFFEIRDL
jgi:hypothetical protein